MSSSFPDTVRRTARRAGLGVLWYHLTHPHRTAEAAFRRFTASLRPLPDFLIIGANKCGTTSLHNYLNQHPQVREGIYKEMHFFDRYHRYANGMDWYRSHFPIRTDPDAFCLGESTPEYLFNPAVPQRVADVMPNVRLIALLRNPIDRAYSHYHHSRRLDREPLSFEEALEAEPDRIDDELTALATNSTYDEQTYEHYSYLARGRYLEQIQRWLRHFPRHQLLVVKSEDLFENPEAVVQGVFDFLDLPPHSPEVHRAHNTGGYRDEMDPEVRARLRDYFRSHNQALAEFLDKPIGWT
jgi:hypothetical protein